MSPFCFDFIDNMANDPAFSIALTGAIIGVIILAIIQGLTKGDIFGGYPPEEGKRFSKAYHKREAAVLAWMFDGTEKPNMEIEDYYD